MAWMDGRRLGYVHRIAYVWAHGTIPDAHDVHHECRTRACFNPDHLVAVHCRDHGREHADATACVRGHPYPESRRPGRADCAVCHREDERARVHRQPSYGPARKRAEHIRTLASTGMGRAKIAEVVGVSVATVRRTLLGEVHA